tara:strand:- start:6638 stop:7174 length:537 start_codon:yes stop_codon:yes gene_type:complete
MVKLENNLIGILGGSFDPPHIGHLKISNISIKRLKLKKLIWLITKKNPFKKKSLFSLNERINKCKKITKKNKKIKIQYLERKVNSSRIIDVVKYLFKKNNNIKIFLIIGSDNLINFHKWKNYKKIISLCRIVVFKRTGFDKKANKAIKSIFSDKSKIIHIKNSKIDISSSKLRKIYLK